MDFVTENCFSEKLYEYLCEDIGSERRVHARRVFFRVMDEIFSRRPFTTFISSGSKAEGLDMNGSDIDVMNVVDILPVFHDKTEVNNPIGFITHFEHSPPGFVLLTGVSGHNDVWLFTHTEYGAVLSNEKFKRSFQKAQKGPYDDFIVIHGPCLVPKNADIDNAYCLRSASWPAMAHKWFQRPKSYNWPPSDVILKVADAGLLYVPIGSKFGTKESNPYEWRISFSMQEKLLIFSFTHTQLLCYAMLKLVLKEIIEKEKEKAQLLCSYFMKTAVFWISEECCTSEWKPSGLYSCFRDCLQRLTYWVQLGYCPNYFIPEHNMFEGKIYGKNRKVLLSFLEGLISLGPNIVSQSFTLAKLNETSVRHFPPNEDVDRGIYPLFHLFLKFVSLEVAPHRYLPFLLTKMSRASKGGLAKTLYFRWLVYFCVQLLTEIPYNATNKNKLLYPGYKTCRIYCLLGKNTDVVSGWLWLATFFYQHREFYKALNIIDKILVECTPDKFLVSDSETLSYECSQDYPANASFFTRHKLSCVYQLYKVPRFGTVFYKSDLNLSQFVDGILAPPVVFIHFLRTMCYHRLGNVFDRNKCLQDMESTIEEDFLIDGAELRMYAYMNLMRVFWLINDMNRAKEALGKVLSEMRKLPVYYDVYRSYFANL